MTKVNTIDGSVNNHENGLVSENIRLKDEVTYLIKTCKNYEDRFIEMENEVQVSKKTLKIARLYGLWQYGLSSFQKIGKFLAYKCNGEILKNHPKLPQFFFH